MLQVREEYHREFLGNVFTIKNAAIYCSEDIFLLCLMGYMEDKAFEKSTSSEPKKSWSALYIS
jgi:hypothetical protein